MSVMSDITWFMRYVTFLLYYFPMLVLVFNPMQAQDSTELVGRILDEDGAPISKANIYNMSDKHFETSAQNGRFKMWVGVGDTLSLMSHTFKSLQYIVPTDKRGYTFHDFVLTLDRERLLSQYKKKTSAAVNKDNKTGNKVRIKLVGRSRNAGGLVLPDVHVDIKNSLSGTISNSQGVYEIDVYDGDTVQFSFLGHAPQLYVVAAEGETMVLHDVMLVPKAYMLQGIEVTSKRLNLNLGYQKVGMGAGEVSSYTIRSQAMRADKTYIPTFGVSTASLGGISGLLQKIKKPGQKKKQEDMTQRQRIMRQKLMHETEQLDTTGSNDSVLIKSGIL